MKKIFLTILFILKFSPKKYYVLDYSEFEYTKFVLKEINKNNIRQVIVLNKDIAPVLYGQRAACGTIIIDSRSKRLLKKIKKYLKGKKQTLSHSSKN